MIIKTIIGDRRGIIPLLIGLFLPLSAMAAAEPASYAGPASLLPPVIAICLALLLRQVIPALFIGIWIGTWAIHGFSAAGLLRGLLDSFTVHIVDALAERDHAAVILFSMMIGGMVGIISRNGGMQGIVQAIAGFASNVRRTCAATVALGLAIFFDDYANTLVVGNTMRPVTDRMNISREKLAYLVDSTAAPISCIALVSSWIGYEVGLIREAIAGIPGLELNAYFVFLKSIPFSFYPLLALALVFSVVYTGRDIGPMRKAERRARETGQTAPNGVPGLTADADMQAMAAREGVPHRAWNAAVPIAVLIAGVMAGLYDSGTGETAVAIIGSSDPYLALLWGSLLGVSAAAALTLGQRILTVGDTVMAWMSGIRSMLPALVILILAWGLSSITEVLGTAEFLVSIIGVWLHPGLMPALVFVLAAGTAFATGSSWGTMGILLPLTVPTVWALLALHGMADDAHLYVLYATVAAVLGGAVWGDHCSPISDTTILSSVASGCDHIEHVRTQLPYALLAGIAAVVFCALPAGFGVPWWLCLLAGLVAVVLALRLAGERQPD